MSLNITMVEDHPHQPRITVIGVGGAGGNAVGNMIEAGLRGVNFVAANTDIQALELNVAEKQIRLGAQITEGLGAGANPEVGAAAAEESYDEINEAIRGSHMVFITAGMGGGTGTGAAPVIAQIAKEMGVLTVAVVTKPFGFERGKRMALAEQGIKELSESVDSLITIPNDKLMPVLGKQTTVLEVFNTANDVLRGAVQGIAELITCPGLINVDFADVRTVMSEMGMAMMGSGEATGEDRATEAAVAAISSPLLEDIDIAGAQGILVNVTAGLDLAIGELDDVGSTITELASDDATVVVGTVIDSEMTSGELRVTLVATGLGKEKKQQKPDVSVATPIIKPEKTGQVDYTKLDQPINMRGTTSKKVVGDSIEIPEDKESLEYLEIPAFLRRQAD